MGFKMQHVRSLGDCTSTYDVIFDGQMTVREFIEDILKRKEWGYVSFNGTKMAFGSKDKVSRIEYKDDKITSSENMDGIMDRVIKVGMANGGWGNMDYRLELEEDVNAVAKSGKKTTVKAGKKTIAGITAKALLKTLEEKNINAELHIGTKETKPVRNPGAAGICTTKNGNLMVYMVDGNGKLCNTSVHTDRKEANARVLERLIKANA